jgi:hypothetical protein
LNDLPEKLYLSVEGRKAPITSDANDNIEPVALCEAVLINQTQ